MTPREKAIKLVNDFWEQITYKLGEDTSKERAKKCALICVNETLKYFITVLGWDEKTNGNIEYWLEVKQEIIKL